MNRVVLEGNIVVRLCLKIEVAINDADKRFAIDGVRDNSKGHLAVFPSKQVIDLGLVHASGPVDLANFLVGSKGLSDGLDGRVNRDARRERNIHGWADIVQSLFSGVLDALNALWQACPGNSEVLLCGNRKVSHKRGNALWGAHDIHRHCWGRPGLRDADDRRALSERLSSCGTCGNGNTVFSGEIGHCI